MRHLGIDYGTKKVGLALSDEGGTMGFPAGIILNNEKLSDVLVAFIAEKDVKYVVLGESKNFQGEDNPIANPARALGSELAERTGIPVAYENEIYSSQQARRLPDGSYDASSTSVDAKAAALILTSYLERHGRKD